MPKVHQHSKHLLPPTLQKKVTEATLLRLIPDSSVIVVTEDFAKRNELDIKVTNKRLIPVPDDFKVGGEIKYVTIPSINVGDLVLNDVTALISGSEEGINGVSPKASRSDWRLSQPLMPSSTVKASSSSVMTELV